MSVLIASTAQAASYDGASCDALSSAAQLLGYLRFGSSLGTDSGAADFLDGLVALLAGGLLLLGARRMIGDESTS